MTNGPKIRLNRAPGRRSTSTMSLLTNAVVRVQLLSGPSRNSFIVIRLGSMFAIVFGSVVGALHQRGKHLVEGRPVLAAGLHIPAGGLDCLHHSRQGRRG